MYMHTIFNGNKAAVVSAPSKVVNLRNNASSIKIYDLQKFHSFHTILKHLIIIKTYTEVGLLRFVLIFPQLNSKKSSNDRKISTFITINSETFAS